MPVRLGDLLVEEHLITPQQLQQALGDQKINGGKLGLTLVKLGFVKDSEITALLSRQYGVPSIALSQFKIDNDVIKLIPGETARKYHVVPLSCSGATPDHRDDRPDQHLRDGRPQVHDGLQRRAGCGVRIGRRRGHRAVLL